MSKFSGWGDPNLHGTYIRVLQCLMLMRPTSKHVVMLSQMIIFIAEHISTVTHYSHFLSSFILMRKYTIKMFYSRVGVLH